MLGELLEFSVAADSASLAVDFYRTLGFREAIVGNHVEEPYVPLSLDDVVVGVRPGDAGAPVPTFVRPDLKNHLRGFKRIDLRLEFSEIADDQFHRAGFRDPNGLLIVLLEARTCSPLPPASSIVSPLGDFLEYSVPTHSIEASIELWERLGIKTVERGETPQPWCRMRGHGLTLGFYAGRRFRPGLSFSCDTARARVAYLEATGFHIDRSETFGLPGRDVLTLEAPSHPIYLVATGL